jgi:type IV secretory pathway TrbF-like protein
METKTDTTLSAGASAYVDQLAQIEATTTAELARIEQAYREIQRRDGAAQWHTQIWQRFALLLVVALLGTTGYVVYLAMQARQVQAFVQPVQLTEEGTMVLIGVPQDLLAYQPQDSEYMDMLAQWVTKRRWRGDDEQRKRTRNDWLWLYRHSCGLASQELARAEKTEQPFKASSVQASLEIKTITKTATPESYQVVWHEVRVDSKAASLKEQDYIGTFTVGRVRPKDLTEAMDNRLGLCVSGYDIAPKAGS